MDIIKRSVDTFLLGGRLVYEDIYSVVSDPASVWHQITNLHWRVNTSIILLGTVILGFLIITVLAQYTEDSSTLPSKEAPPVQRPGDPPIPPPTEIISLRIYPIKSCRGIEIDATRLKKTGLSLDRNWMFISKADRKFMTIRGNASMTLVDTSLVDSTPTSKNQEPEQMLEVSVHGKDTRVQVPAFPTREWLDQNTKLGTVEIWEQETDAWEYGDEINKPFSEFFEKPVALVYKGPTHRMNRVNGSKELYGKDTPHHFADVVSLQIASEASIADLNRRLGVKNDSKDGGTPHDLTIERFRPNIIVRGRASHPWEEDTWKRIRITTTLSEEHAIYRLDLDAVARCARCQVPNVNPDTAEKHAKEPWDELMKFRRVDTGGPAKWKPCFGMLCIPKNEGKVRIGAKVEVLETTSNHLYDTRKFVDL